MYAEREGRFVHRHASECGIHTRVSNTKKAPHGGGLVKLLTEQAISRDGVQEEALQPAIDYDHTMELNERQVN